MSSKYTVYVPVDLTYLRDEQGRQPFPRIIEFYAEPYMEADFRKFMQSHFGLTESERRDRQHEFNVSLISSLAARITGLPDFEASGNLKEDLKNRLLEKTEENEMIAQKLVDEHIGTVRSYSFRS